MCSRGKNSVPCKRNSLIKDYASPVYDSLLGHALVNRNVVVLENHCIILRKDYKFMKGKVKIIAGGGAGVEPSEACYVGKGLLTAAVLGEIFTSPSASEILLAIRELSVENPEGILLLVKNYVGDRLNFTIAMNQALKENISVKMLVIQDHIFYHVPARQGRHGMAGSVLVYKIAGEMAEQGKLLEEIIEECEDYVLNDLATASVTLSDCSSINVNVLKNLIGPDEIILGLGMYGKGGVKKIKMSSLEEVVALVLEEIVTFFNANSKLVQNNVIVLVNNLGATTKLEEAVVAKEVSSQLNRLGFRIAKLYMGTFMSSYATQGFSVSILKLNSQEIIKYLNAPTTAYGWPGAYVEETLEAHSPDASVTTFPSFSDELLKYEELQNSYCAEVNCIVLSEKASAAMKLITIFAAEALISCEKQLNLIDSEIGDGDIGTVLRRGAEALKRAVFNEEINLTNPAHFLYDVSEVCCKYMAGLSGILYCIFFRAAAKGFENTSVFTPELCCTAFKEAVQTLKFYANVELGDRTMMDALIPAAEAFENALKAGRNLVEATYLAATTSEFKSEETKTRILGPLLQLNARQNLTYPDAGAHATTIWLRAITFDKEIPTQRPGIFLWKFLTEKESEYVLLNEITSSDLMSFIEKKIGPDQNMLASLLLQTIKYCRKYYKRKTALTSALVGSVYYTHRYFMASRWRTPAEVYFYFRECILRQSVESPPISIEIIEPEEAKNILVFFIEIYLRNLPLISILQLPHYKLRLKVKPNTIFNYKPCREKRH